MGEDTQTESVGGVPRESARASGGSFRWVICGLLFFATTVNYIDRNVLGVLAPQLKDEIGWSDTQYGDINAAFQFAYAVGFLVVGRFIDLVGARVGYAVSLVVWSLIAAAHALARTPLQFGLARLFLGFAEAGNFPAAIKATAEWFPRRERALATGIFNAGTNVGATIAPLLVPFFAIWWGWQSAFVVTGLAGLTWVVFWLPIYDQPDRHPRVTPEELAWIRSDPSEPAVRIPWARLLPYRQTWAFAIGKFVTDPIWWFYLYWSAPFFAQRFHADLKSIGPPLVTIYLMADVGSVAGGWLSSWLLKRGWSTNAARKTAMFLCALCVVPVSLAPKVDNMWAAVGLIGLAAAAHQGFSANLFTLTSDLFPRRAVSSVVGIGGMAGAVGGILMQSASGRVVDATGSYERLFLIAAIVYVFSVAAIHLLSPRLEPIRVEDA